MSKLTSSRGHSDSSSTGRLDSRIKLVGGVGAMDGSWRSKDGKVSLVSLCHSEGE